MISKNFSWQLRAFCAAGFALFLSCAPETSIEPVCIGDCNANITIEGLASDNSLTLDYDESGKAYFFIDLQATPTNEHWWYNGRPVVMAELTGNLQYEIDGQMVDAVPEYVITFGERGESMYSRQIAGSKVELIGKTLILQVEVVWEAGGSTVVKKYNRKITLK
jgi:hypothetical protein